MFVAWSLSMQTSLDGDAVSMEILYESTEEGLSYASRQLIKVPAKKVELTIENFNYQKQ